LDQNGKKCKAVELKIFKLSPARPGACVGHEEYESYALQIFLLKTANADAEKIAIKIYKISNSVLWTNL